MSYIANGKWCQIITSFQYDDKLFFVETQVNKMFEFAFLKLVMDLYSNLVNWNEMQQDLFIIV